MHRLVIWGLCKRVCLFVPLWLTVKTSAELTLRWQHVKSLIASSAGISGEIQSDVREKLLLLGGLGPILRVNRALQDVRVCACGVLAWGVGWTGSAGTTAEQMLGINQSHWHGASHQVTSRGVPISYELIKTYERKTEAITADAKVKCI